MPNGVPRVNNRVRLCCYVRNFRICSMSVQLRSIRTLTCTFSEIKESVIKQLTGYTFAI